ncbi:uncharacterized protein sytl2a isoform X2 [Genypterus blacodes]|uniref:uncharacterized protein sytl2a isoform X2 n=1 Tax=Genypterus blacodes TaxID=154954 RepID=UPI003F76FEB9
MTTMIDLSFLTEEEQETILAVLRRDTELKKAEEKRVQQLQRTLDDKSQLKYQTGEWFYETKLLRHQDRIHGSDIIRASMRHVYRPLTLLELSQISPQRPSFVSSENKEVFVPAVLSGLIEEPHTQLSSNIDQSQSPYEEPQEAPKSALLHFYSLKERRNPFNSELTEPSTSEEKAGQLMDRAESQKPTCEALLSPDMCISWASDLTQDCNDSPVPQNASVPLSEVSQHFSEADESTGRENNSSPPRGILKYMPSCSFTDSVFSQDDQSSPKALDSPTEPILAQDREALGWIDRKQVRFSPAVGCGGVKRQDGKELGEHSVLDTDSITPTEEENNNKSLNAGSNLTGMRRPLVKQREVDLDEGDLSFEKEANLLNKDGDQHQVPGDISKHFPTEPLTHQVSSPGQESGKTVHLEPEPEGGHHSQAEAAGWSHQQKLHRQSSDKLDVSCVELSSSLGSKNSSNAVSPKPRQRLLRFFKKGDAREKAELQNQPEVDVKLLKQREVDDTLNSQCAADTAKKTLQFASVKEEDNTTGVTEVRTLHLTALQNMPFKGTMTSLASDTWQEAAQSKKEVLPPRLTFTREQERHETPVEIITNKLSPIPTQTTEHCEGERKVSGSQVDISSPQTQCNLLVDLLKEDRTYRANPVLIFEDSDESLTISQICEIQEIASCPSVTPPSRSAEQQNVPASQSSIQERSSASISELKHFWEKEYSGHRAIVGRVKGTASTSIFSNSAEITDHHNKAISPQSDLITTLNSSEKSEESQCKSVSKLKKVTDKAFISQGSEDEIEFVTEAERPYSPCQSQTLRPQNQSDDEIRRSPTKTCHPKALPRETSSPKGSPLKTFPIDINPKAKLAEKQPEKPTPAPRHKQSPSHEAKQPVLIDTAVQLQSESNSSTANTQQSLESPESDAIGSKEKQPGPLKKLGTFTHLARSLITRDHHHYLGPQERAYLPPFHQDKAAKESHGGCLAVAAAVADAVHTPQSALGDFVADQSDSTTEGSRTKVGSWIEPNTDDNSSQDTTTMVWSLSRASPGSSDDDSHPVMSALKRFSTRSRPSSRSLDNLLSPTREEGTKCNSEEQLNLSEDDVYAGPSLVSSLSIAKQRKASQSVPVLHQEETDSDSTFETNMGLRRNTGSSTSNISLSSGMASMSSVSGSVTSIYPADFGDIEVQGTMQFAVNYIQKLGEFHIFVVHCRDLAVADHKKSRSDPYVKCYLLPDKTKLGKRKTSVKKKNLSPSFNEILRFKVTMAVLKTQTLNISIWHNDTFGRNSFLGEVDLDLSEWDFNNTQINDYPLKARVIALSSTQSPSRSVDSRPQMRVALRFLPTTHSKTMSKMETGEVQIWVKDCKSLPPVRGLIIDPFVKCTVLPDTSKKNRQKTRVVKRTANPMFNHTMVYDGFRPEDLIEACVEITVWDHDRLNNHYMGGLRLGLGTGKSYGVEVVWMDSTTDEAKLWQKMLQSNGEWVEDVLPLRKFVMAKSTLK